MSIAERQLIAFDIFLKNPVNIGMTSQETEREFIIIRYCRLLFCQQSQNGKINFLVCWALC